MVADHFNLHPWYEQISKDRVRCIIQNSRTAATRYYHCHALWTLVGHIFGVGSTSAMEICRYAGMDPNERVKPLKIARSSTGCPKR
jgi:hypothetical protein